MTTKSFRVTYRKLEDFETVHASDMCSDTDGVTLSRLPEKGYIDMKVTDVNGCLNFYGVRSLSFWRVESLIGKNR